MEGKLTMQEMNEIEERIMDGASGCWEVASRDLLEEYTFDELKEMVHNSYYVSISDEAMPVMADRVKDPLDYGMSIVKRFPFRACSTNMDVIERLSDGYWNGIGDGTRFAINGHDHIRQEIVFHPTVDFSVLEEVAGEYGIVAKENNPLENTSVDFYLSNGGYKRRSDYVCSINRCRLPEQIADFMVRLIEEFGVSKSMTTELEVKEIDSRMYLNLTDAAKKMRFKPNEEFHYICEYGGRSVEADGYLSLCNSMYAGKVLKSLGAYPGCTVRMTFCRA